MSANHEKLHFHKCVSQTDLGPGFGHCAILHYVCTLSVKNRTSFSSWNFTVVLKLSWNQQLSWNFTHLVRVSGVLIWTLPLLCCLFYKSWLRLCCWRWVSS